MSLTPLVGGRTVEGQGEAGRLGERKGAAQGMGEERPLAQRGHQPGHQSSHQSPLHVGHPSTANHTPWTHRAAPMQLIMTRAPGRPQERARRYSTAKEATAASLPDMSAV